jgi:ubiquinone/menaquinone biosynthesis C-methylase UbiE
LFFHNSNLQGFSRFFYPYSLAFFLISWGFGKGSNENKKITNKAQSNDYFFFVKKLFDEYGAHQELYNDEFVENRYGLDRLLKILREDNKNGKILDVGCGNCELIASLQRIGYDVTGIDISIVRILNNRNRIQKLYFGFSECLPIENESMDILLCLECLEHAMDVEASLKEFSRVLKSMGVLYIQVPLKNKVESSNHVRLFTVETLQNLTAKYFTIEKIEVIPYLFGEEPNNIFLTGRKINA